MPPDCRSCPGLVRYDEVAAGLIDHAIRVTFSQTQRGFILPATHFASSNRIPTLPPMGMRLRLSAGYDIAGLTGQARVIADRDAALRPDRRRQRQQLVLPGCTQPGWNDDDLDQLKSIPGTAFEVVDTGPVQTG